MESPSTADLAPTETFKDSTSTILRSVISVGFVVFRPVRFLRPASGLTGMSRSPVGSWD